MANQIQNKQVGRYQPYPEYKDSGVEWLGKIPSHWDLWKLKHAYSNIGSGTTPPTSSEEWFYKGTIPWVTTGELRENIITHTNKYLTNKAYGQFSALRIYPAGSIVIAMYGATIGRLGILGIPATTNQACCVICHSTKIDNKYLFYWLYAFRNEIINLSSGGGQPNINQEKVSFLKISAPLKKEQTQIAQFLDYETAKIDLLIEKQQKLIELLKEKRQAVISHAVTKGLDPNVEMKDSGVEWESKLPLGWEIKSVSHYFYAKKGSFASTLTKEYCESIKGNYPVFSGQTENNGILSYINTYEFNLEKGAILVTTVGAKAMTLKFIQGKFSLSQNCMIILSKNNCIDLRYIFYLFQVIFIYYRSLIPDHMQPSFRMEDFYSMKFFVPPLQEQTQIAEYLDTQTSKIDLLIEKAEAQITLMQERRTALISAAVTGKIDFRHWQMPEVSDHQGGDYE